MLSSIISAFSGAMKAINAWFKKKERDDHIQAGIDKQAVAQHETNEKARAEKRLRDARIDSDDDLSDKLRDAFRDSD